MIGNKPPHLWRWTSRKYFNSIINDRITAWKSQEEPSKRRILQMIFVSFSFAIPAMYSFGTFCAQERTDDKIKSESVKIPPPKKVCKNPPPSGAGNAAGAGSASGSKPCKNQKPASTSGPPVEAKLPPCPGE